MQVTGISRQLQLILKELWKYAGMVPVWSHNTVSIHLLNSQIESIAFSYASEGKSRVVHASSSTRENWKINFFKLPHCQGQNWFSSDLSDLYVYLVLFMSISKMKVSLIFLETESTWEGINIYTCQIKVLSVIAFLNLSEPETFLHMLVVSMHPLTYELVSTAFSDDSRSLRKKSEE